MASGRLPQLNGRRNDLVAVIKELERIAHEQDPSGLRRSHDRRERQSAARQRNADLARVTRIR
jgi:hypothetical protein